MIQEVPINSKVKIHYNLGNKSGLFVTKIEKDSPASRSQLEEGDIIVSFNNKWINNSHELFKELSNKDRKPDQYHRYTSRHFIEFYYCT